MAILSYVQEIQNSRKAPGTIAKTTGQAATAQLNQNLMFLSLVQPLCSLFAGFQAGQASAITRDLPCLLL